MLVTINFHKYVVSRNKEVIITPTSPFVKISFLPEIINSSE